MRDISASQIYHKSTRYAEISSLKKISNPVVHVTGPVGVRNLRLPDLETVGI